jgi:hypothetical protein
MKRLSAACLGLLTRARKLPGAFWWAFLIPFPIYLLLCPILLFTSIFRGPPIIFIFLALASATLIVFFNGVVITASALLNRKSPSLLGKYKWCSLGLFLGTSASILLFISVTYLGTVHHPLPSGSYHSDFDSEVWKDVHSADPMQGKMISKREQMLGDVVDHVLLGKTKQQIENLLGPGLDTPYFYESDKDLIYYLGPERGNWIANIDSEWLLIWCDDHGRFGRYEICND